MATSGKRLAVRILSIFLLLGIALSTTVIDAAADKQMLLNIQQAIKAKNMKWTAADNEISRLSSGEIRDLLGWLPEPVSNLYEYGAEIIDGYSYTAQLPPTFDWRNHNGKNYMTPVKRQLCGDCWAHAAAAALEGRLAIDGQPGWICRNNYWSRVVAMPDHVVVDTSSAPPGLSPMWVFPVKAVTPIGAGDSACGEACSDWRNKTLKAPSYTRVSQTVGALKAAVYNRGPINVGYMVYEDFSSYRSGIYEHTWGRAQGGHAVVIVGYDDPQQCFIVKNSWGANWGENGYFRIAYSQVSNEVDFGAEACVYGDDIGPDPNPDPDPDSDNELDNGKTVSDLSAAAGAWVHYKIKVPAGATNLKIAISGGSGDADLYSRFGAEPTLNSFDCRPYRWGNTESCTSDAPSAGYYHIGLYGYDAFSGVNLTASYDAQGPDPDPDPDPEPSGAVEILGAWASGTSHAKAAGANRALVFTVHAEDNDSDIRATSVTYGGRPLQKVVERIASTGYRAYVAAFILDEAGIEAATSADFVVKWNQRPYRTPKYSSAFLANVNQGGLTGATASAGTTSGTVSTQELPTYNGDMVIVAATCGNPGQYSPNNGFTEGMELAITSADGMVAYKTANGENETPKVTHSNVNRQALISMVVAAD